MQVRRRVIFVAICAILGLISTTNSSAGPFSSIVVYGDSLSDSGNLYSLVGYPPYPYFNGRFSDGPVAVEQLATHMGVPLYDFAFGGATTGLGNFIDGGNQATLGAFGLPGMQLEIAGSAGLVSSIATGSLFVVWGGANDFFSGDSPLAAAANVDAYVMQLKSMGANQILVPGIPDLGLTPEFYGIPIATAYSQAYNAALKSGLPSGAVYFDTYSLLHSITNNPADYGLTNVNTPCFDGVNMCSDPDRYLFWDHVHPTSAADAILAEQFQSAVTPEPAAWLLVGTGCIVGILFSRRLIA
jgi:phospholipase/lecithinase/hemolysin